MTKPAFRKGEKIPNAPRAVDHIQHGGWVYLNDKLQGPGWTQNWSVHLINGYCRSGRLFFAFRRTEAAE